MISSNTLSLFILDHDHNRVCNCNIHLIQDLMHLENPDGAKFKRVCADFPNIALLTKRATPDDIQFNFGQAPVGNNYLKKTVTDFAIAGSLESPTVVSIDAERAFAITGKNICIPVTELLLCTTIGDLTRSKKMRVW